MRFTIDCSDCSRQRTSSCQDCVVTFVTSREPDEAVVVDAAEFAALRRLSAAGLIPTLRHDSADRIEWVTDAELAEPDRLDTPQGGVEHGPGEEPGSGPSSLRDAG